jgi:preprotein translocase subunit SecE
MPNKKTVRLNKEKMEGKKNANTPERKSYFSPSGIREFLFEVESEFRKITWPSPKTATGLTGFVILLVVLISLYLGVVDLLLGKLVSSVLK